MAENITNEDQPQEEPRERKTTQDIDLNVVKRTQRLLEVLGTRDLSTESSRELLEKLNTLREQVGKHNQAINEELEKKLFRERAISLVFNLILMTVSVGLVLVTALSNNKDYGEIAAIVAGIFGVVGGVRLLAGMSWKK